MAAIFNSLFGGSKPVPGAAPGDSDFADFAGAPEPVPAPVSPASTGSLFGFGGAVPTASGVPWTKWYNVHERHSLSEFKPEGLILICILAVMVVHIFGSRINRSKAKSWISVHAPALKREFALVGFGGRAGSDEVEGAAPPSDDLALPEKLIKEKSITEFVTYGTGRQNVAFVDVNINLLKRYNPLIMIADYALSFFFESMPAPVERMVAILYPFDGKEALTVPGQVPGATEARKDSKSAYDGFVWAVVNKASMKSLRDERFDVSLTTTKDHVKLPNWATVMSEASEITELLLTPELVKAVESAGELLEFLVISDQPIDKPTTLIETTPKKRVYLTTRIPSSAADYEKTLPLFEYFLRVPDLLVSSAHFRPEVLRKVKATRDDTIRKLQKADDDEKAEERAIEREKAKKLKRDLELKGLDAKAQKKYLEKEKEREQKKMAKKQTMRG